MLPFTKGWGGVTPGVNIPARDRASINNDRSQLKLVPRRPLELGQLLNVPDKIHRREEYTYVAGVMYICGGLTIYPPSEYSLIGFFVAVWGVAS